MDNELKVTIEYPNGSKQSLVLRDGKVEMQQDITSSELDPPRYVLGSKFALITGWVEKVEYNTK